MPSRLIMALNYGADRGLAESAALAIGKHKRAIGTLTRLSRGYSVEVLYMTGFREYIVISILWLITGLVGLFTLKVEN